MGIEKSAISPYINRELSWLKFNERVLEEAEDQRLPLFERMRFLSIFGSNLDEFFMVRVGGLYDALNVSPDEVDKSGMTVTEQLVAIYENVHQIMPRVESCYVELMEQLSEQQIYHVDVDHLTPYQETVLEKYFRNEIRPFLSPQVIDKHHPFPFLSSKELYVGIQFETMDKKVELAVIAVTTKNFPRYFIFPDESGRGFCYVITARLVYYFADMIFKKRLIKDKFIFRVTRNGDLRLDEALYDEEVDWRDQMERIIKKRKHSAVVRLQLSKHVSSEVQHFLLKKLEAKKRALIVTSELPLSLSHVFGVLGELAPQYPALNYPPMTPLMPECIMPGDSIIDYIDKAGDIFLAYPYHSMKTFLDLLDEAAVDPSVTAIRITLYRIASGSKVAQALAKAAENGKDVFVLVELKARFDEEHNIIWSKRLEEAGCQVIYGFDNYKVHSKLCVITRTTEQGIRHITQIGTGNYNEKTARQYTDFSLITPNPEIAAEALNVFASMGLGQFVETSRYLLVAPLQMLNKYVELIEKEIDIAKSGEEARIIAKVNGLSQKTIIDKLIEASQAGVQITLYVRGICCLRAGIPGMTDNIVIKSMVGRFLEHPRFFVFGLGEREKIYIGSADWMTRNLNYRVEVGVEILDPNNKAIIHDIVDILAKDNMLARVMMPDGTYKRLYPAKGELEIDSQIEQYKLFKQRKEESDCISIAENYQRVKAYKKSPDFSTDKRHVKDVIKEAVREVVIEQDHLKESSQEADSNKNETGLKREPQTFMERLKYVLFGKF